ncbi:hypothetical protein NMY22_g11114 [Coprinellus aureogranulatus]|nr:hypothetical protein NMY22_g11114 [Coprinellus aureogranulatus]
MRSLCRIHECSAVALVLFPLLTVLSAKLILGHLSIFEPVLRDRCSPNSADPSNIPYTSVPALDAQLCFVVAFFHSVLDHSQGSDFLVYFIGTSSIYVILPCLEAVRRSSGRTQSVWANSHTQFLESLVVRTNEIGIEGKEQDGWNLSVKTPAKALGPLAMGISSASLPPHGFDHAQYMARSITSCIVGGDDGPVRIRLRAGVDTTSSGTKYPGESEKGEIDGEAIAFATVLGAALPSIALFRYSRPSVTVLWQAFPLYIFLARIGYQCLATSLFHRPASHAAPRNVQSSPVKGGYQFIRVTLLTSFALSTYFHIAFVMSTLRTGLPPSASFPSLTVLSWAEPGSVDFVSLNALIFLLWDFIFSSISTLAALALDAIAAGKSVAKSKWTIVGSRSVEPFCLPILIHLTTGGGVLGLEKPILNEQIKAHQPVAMPAHLLVVRAVRPHISMTIECGTAPSALYLMSRYTNVHDDHSDVETASTVGYSTPSTAATAVFHDEPFLSRNEDALPTLLHISNAVAIGSFCCSIPFLGASNLFQTPFIATSTLEFNRSILNPPASSSERQLLIKKRLWTHEDDFPNEGEELRSKRARHLIIRWALAAFVVAAISGSWTAFSLREYGKPGLTAWLYVAWVEVVLDLIQAILMHHIRRRCRRRESMGPEGFEEPFGRIISEDGGRS